MLVLILINYQYSQNVIFSFEKSSNGQNYSPSDSHPSDKKVLTQQKFFILPLNAIWKTLPPPPPPHQILTHPMKKFFYNKTSHSPFQCYVENPMSDA